MLYCYITYWKPFLLICLIQCRILCIINIICSMLWFTTYVIAKQSYSTVQSTVVVVFDCCIHTTSIKQWVCQSIDQKRTTNGCERFHRQLNSFFFHCSSLSIYELICKFYEIRIESKFKLNTTENSMNNKRKNAWIDWKTANIIHNR